MNNTEGNLNTAIGANALYLNTTGSENMGIGSSALYNNLDGTRNIAIGAQSLLSNSSASDNIALGKEALRSNTTGLGNIAIGYQSGYTDTTANANVTGNYNIFLGYNSGPNNIHQLNNAIAIGKNAKVETSNSMILGGTGTDQIKVGIGMTNPSTTLDVSGDAHVSSNLSVDGDFILNTGMVNSNSGSVKFNTDIAVNTPSNGIIMRAVSDPNHCVKITMDTPGNIPTLLFADVTCP